MSHVSFDQVEKKSSPLKQASPIPIQTPPPYKQIERECVLIQDLNIDTPIHLLLNLT